MPAEGMRGASAGSANKTGGLDNTLGHKSVLDKQKAAIDKLRTQNEQLKHELLLENKFSVRPGDPYAQALINRLQDEGDLLARKIVLEMRKARMLDQKLADIGSTLGSTRNLMGGINAAKEKSQEIQKRIKVLENRLEKAYVKYNQSITHNKELREQINNLRRERIMFESIHTNLERELAKMKKEMADIILLANAAFDAREKVLGEMNNLKLQIDKEQQGFEEEWKQLTAIIEEDKRERERARAQELAMRERETQDLLKSGNVSLEKRKKASKGSWSIGFSKAMAQNVAAEKVQMYGQAFEKIQQATGIEEIDDLVNTFVMAEDQNYTLFNYVNEVNQEIEKLEDQITQIRSEIDRYREVGQENDRSKSSTLRDVEERLSAAESQAELYEKRYDAASSTVNTLKVGIWELFNKIGCNTPAVRDLLGDESVTEGNIMAYLGIIEQRANEILRLSAMYKGGEAGEALREALTAQPLTSASPRFVIEPPSTLVVEEDAEAPGEGDGDDEKPLSRENLENRVARTLPRKLDAAIKVRPPGAETSPKKSPRR